jgi:hypothetical protein
MFENQQPEKKWSSNWMFKTIAFGACGFGLGAGLCGMDAHFYPRAEFGGSMLALFGAGFIVISTLAIALVLLVVMVKLVSRLFPK